jgi:hypothetical protein
MLCAVSLCATIPNLGLRALKPLPQDVSDPGLAGNTSRIAGNTAVVIAKPVAYSNMGCLGAFRQCPSAS